MLHDPATFANGFPHARFDGLEVTAPVDVLPRVHSNLIDGYAHVPIRWDSLLAAGSNR